MITICLLILAFWFLGKPVGNLVSKLGDVDWNKLTHTAWENIVKYSRKAGRQASPFSRRWPQRIPRRGPPRR